MGLSPNKEQISFIESKNSNVLVSASAGSGKTYTMIQKLIYLIIEEKTPINSLLVLTFTEAAASEIKQRLYNEISNLINDTEGDTREFLQKQLDNINDAEIGTLHSVCKKIIIKYFYELEISPDFAILSEKESKYLLDNAISDVFEKKILADDDMFFDLYDCYNAKRNDTSLKQMIIQLFNYISNKIDYANWLQNNIDDSFNIDLNENSVCKYLFSSSKYKIAIFKNTIEELIFQAKAGGFDRYLEFLYQRMQFVDEIGCSKNFLQFVKILWNMNLIKKPNALRNASADENEFDENIAKFHKEFGDSIKKIHADIMFDNEKDILDNFALAKKNICKLIELLYEIKSEYEELKRNKNYLDFNDLEDKMIELLKSQEVKTALQKNYKYIFFDEYQDINEKQERILSEIVSGDNYYMIGDVKQSIYAFRQSSPKIFIEKFNKFKKDNVKNKVINFNKNYRSDKNILEFNNFIFDTLITEKTIGIDYKTNSRFDSINEFKQCNVDLKIIDKKIDSDEFVDIDEDRNEAIVIADTISQILTQTKEDGTRYTYRDIAIILRKRGSFLKTLCQVLQSMQIPINTTINNDFFSSFEINLLLSILKVVSNYKDDVALSVVLKNLFDVNEKELLKIRTSSTSKYFYECVEGYSENDSLKDKIIQFFEFIYQSRIELSKLNLYDYMENIIAKYNILKSLKSLPNGEERENNVYEFLSLLNNDLYKYNIDKFIEYIDYISKDSTLQKIGVSGNSVQICTIHYSKGLEYPAVILAGLGKKFSLNKDTNDMIINDKFGVGLKAIDNKSRILKETIIRNACKMDNRQSEINEEIRLLYVAMTRPKEYLCLIGEYNLDKILINREKGIYSSSNYLDMIFKAIEAKELNKFLSNKIFILNEGTGADIRVEIIKNDSIIDDEDIREDKLIIGGIDGELESLLQNVYNYRPDMQTFTIKNTVTNILKEESDYENLNFMPKELSVNDKVISKDYLKIGTAYHTIMQNLQFTESLQDIEELIKMLVVSGEIPKEVVKEIQIKEIWNAKEVLKDIILNADEVYKEKQFVMQENYNKLVKNSDNNTKVIIQGIIDLVVVKDGETILIDYKTNRTKNELELINNYNLQLDIYKLAFEKATKINVDKKFLYSFYLNRLIEIK